MTITDEQLEQWEKLCAEASPGPWTAITFDAFEDGDDPNTAHAEVPEMLTVPMSEGDFQSLTNARFAAAARDAVPLLVAEVRALHVEVEKLKLALHWATLEDQMLDAIDRGEDYVDYDAPRCPGCDGPHAPGGCRTCEACRGIAADTAAEEWQGAASAAGIENRPRSSFADLKAPDNLAEIVAEVADEARAAAHERTAAYRSRPAEVGDVYRFEYPASPQFNCALRVTHRDGRGPDDRAFFEDGSHAKQKTLTDAMRVVPVAPVDFAEYRDRGGNTHGMRVTDRQEPVPVALAGNEVEKLNARPWVKGCHSDDDGDCNWEGCPQLRDGEPKATHRHCPLYALSEED